MVSRRASRSPRPSTLTCNNIPALRRAVPQVAGEPVVSLVRNEMIHHEAILALATALARYGYANNPYEIEARAAETP